MVYCQTCSILGPSKFPSKEACWGISSRLEFLLSRLCCHLGVHVFFTGSTMGLDALADLILLHMRQIEPKIHLYRIASMFREQYDWTPLDHRLHFELSGMESDWDLFVPYIEDVHARVRAQSKYMLHNSDYCIYYLSDDTSPEIVEWVDWMKANDVVTFDLADSECCQKILMLDMNTKEASELDKRRRVASGELLQ